MLWPASRDPAGPLGNGVSTADSGTESDPVLQLIAECPQLPRSPHLTVLQTPGPGRLATFLRSVNWVECSVTLNVSKGS